MKLREDIDKEIDQHDGASELVLLVPEDGWAALSRAPGVEAQNDGQALYRGVRLRRAPVTAVIPEEGF